MPALQQSCNQYIESKRKNHISTTSAMNNNRLLILVGKFKKTVRNLKVELPAIEDLVLERETGTDRYRTA